MFTLRKNVLGLSTLLLTVCAMSFTCVEAFADSSGYIRGTNVNVRKDHSTSSKSVATLSNKDVIIIDSWNDWYKISSGDITGWVNDDFVIKKVQSSNAVKSNAQSNNTNKSTEAVIKGTNVNIRSEHTTNSKVVLNLSNKKVKILGSYGDWYKISYNGTEGWVRKDLISVSSTTTSSNKQVSQTASTGSNKTGKIKGINVNVRSKPTKTATIVATVSNQKINILAQSGDWYKISAGNTTGWVSKDFVAVTSGSTNNASSSSSKTSTASSNSKLSSIRSKLVLSSRGYLGVRYVYGGSSPSGFDCSGFTSYVYKKNGINLERTASDQAKQGKYVAKSNLQPGDLVFFDTNGGKTKKINHAGIYIGNGKFIHASSSKKGRYVKINALNTGFYAKAYVTGRTFVK